MEIAHHDLVEVLRPAVTIQGSSLWKQCRLDRLDWLNKEYEADIGHARSGEWLVRPVASVIGPARQGRWMPCVTSDRDPRGRVVKDVQTESYEPLDERRYTRLSGPGTVAACQEYLLVDQRSRKDCQNAGRDTEVVRLHPDDQGSRTWEQVVHVDAPRIFGTQGNGARHERQCHRKQVAHASLRQRRSSERRNKIIKRGATVDFTKTAIVSMTAAGLPCFGAVATQQALRHGRPPAFEAANSPLRHCLPEICRSYSGSIFDFFGIRTSRTCSWGGVARR
jgi:hypothetical protein